jgi:hypothetical protein
MDELGKPKKTGSRRSADYTGHGVRGPTNLVGISLSVEGEEFDVKFHLPDHVSEDDKAHNAEKIGTFLAILQQGKLASLLTFSAAKWGVINKREEEAQILIRTMHVGMNLNVVGGEIVEPPLVSPLDAFVMRKES